jgi:hypothetical protein
VGIRIHSLKDNDGNQNIAGTNPFDQITLGERLLSSVVKLYRPILSVSNEAYAAITNGISDWIEEAIEIRNSLRVKVTDQ